MTNYALYSNSMGSGKTHYSKVWQKNGYTPISLATPLKEQVHEYLDKEGIKYTPNNKETKIVGDTSLRDLYIYFAKQNKLKLGDDVFIKQFLNHVNENPDKQFICDDVRTPEEYKALKDNGFVFIFVDRLLDTPDNEMEGLLFSDVYNHLCNTTDYCIPNYYTSSPNYDQFVFKHIVESKEIDTADSARLNATHFTIERNKRYELLKKILLEGIKKIQDNSNPNAAYNMVIKFKNTKAVDRQVWVDFESFNLHNLKDVSIVTSYIKGILDMKNEIELVVDNSLDSVVELIQMDNNEEED